MNRRIAAFALTLTAAWGLLLCGQASAQEDIRHISVIGEASAMVDPDVIEWSLTLDTRDVDPNKALELNSLMMEAVIELVEDLDIDEEGFETTRGNLRRVHYTPRDSRQERQYLYTKCVRSATIRMRDFEQFDELMLALVQMGVEFEVSYRVSNLNEIKRALSLDALQNAKEIAEEQAEVLGEEIGPARRVEVFEGGNRSYSSGGLFGDGSEPERDTFRPGKVRIEMRADVTFTLVP